MSPRATPFSTGREGGTGRKPSRVRRRALAIATSCVSLAGCIETGCIENRLSVDLFTQVQADGTCTRRIEYRLERLDTGKGDARVAIPPDQDPLLTLHRFPAGDPWRIHDDSEIGLHVVTVEAVGLASAAAIEGDYSRARARKAAPARNVVSAFADPEHALYEYQEVLRDPASPLAGVRLLSRLALKRDDGFARQFAEALGDKGVAPREGDLRRLYRELFAAPFAREVAQIAERPFFGPRERRELDALLQRLDEKQKELVARLVPLTGGASQSDVEAATDGAVQKLGETLLGEIEEAGLPLTADGESAIRFHATLVMPAPILRANTCAAGDTAQWDFDEDDLFGRGFEMKALAGSK